MEPVGAQVTANVESEKDPQYSLYNIILFVYVMSSKTIELSFIVGLKQKPEQVNNKTFLQEEHNPKVQLTWFHHRVVCTHNKASLWGSWASWD